MNSRVRELRTGRGWSQGRLAEMLCAVNAIENGRYAPNLPLAFAIAGLFDLPIEEIFQPWSDFEPDGIIRRLGNHGKRKII